VSAHELKSDRYDRKKRAARRDLQANADLSEDAHRVRLRVAAGQVRDVAEVVDADPQAGKSNDECDDLLGEPRGLTPDLGVTMVGSQ